jgi:hypothetical protein
VLAIPALELRLVETGLGMPLRGAGPLLRSCTVLHDAAPIVAGMRTSVRDGASVALRPEGLRVLVGGLAHAKSASPAMPGLKPMPSSTAKVRSLLQASCRLARIMPSGR